ncbi:hypothetical protein [Micromonospora sp. NPDC004551]|uniref:hypothetical protein n=1 Tax=Micromonospora sp. NPDC004551 TaxID=3154284 RepID=UPI0033BE062E
MGNESIARTDSQQITVRVVWKDVDTIPVEPANQFAAMVGLPTGSGAPDGVIIVMGYAAPPVLLGTPDEVRRTAADLVELPVDVKARFVLTRERLGELIKVLQITAQQYDEAKGEAGSR